MWEGALADVSVVAGVLTDKFCHHLALYRQHQRLAMSGIRVSRSSLTHWVHRACALLAPVYDAQLRHVLLSKTLAMDETPIRAGRSKHRGRMNTGWYWPLYGEADEVVFTFSPKRSRAHLDKVLSEFSGTLLTDGAAAYERFARERAELVHAQCWSHTRRMFVKAEEAEPAAVAEALELIGRLYEVEAHIREQALSAQHALEYRTEHALARVDAFFAWVAQQCHRAELTPSHPLSKALQYAREREGALRVYLTDPAVPIDTNHLERALRPIPMGRNYRSHVIMQGSLQTSPASEKSHRGRIPWYCGGSNERALWRLDGFARPELCIIIKAPAETRAHDRARDIGRTLRWEAGVPLALVPSWQDLLRCMRAS